MRRRTFYARRGKRLVDLGLTITALMVLSPLLGLVALLVRLRLGSPPLYRQRRPGLGGEPFTILKFRTMTDARDADGVLLPDAGRLTRPGWFLRSTSLDELPEILHLPQSIGHGAPNRVEWGRGAISAKDKEGWRLSDVFYDSHRNTA